MPDNILVYGPFTIFISNYYLVLTGFCSYLLNGAVNNTNGCQLSTAIYALSYISANYVDIGTLTYATRKLHGHECVSMVNIILCGAWVLYVWLRLLYRKDGVSTVLTTISAAIYITVNGGTTQVGYCYLTVCIGIRILFTADGHICLVTYRTKLTTAVDVSLDYGITVDVYGRTLNLSQLGPDGVECSIQQCKTSHGASEYVTAVFGVDGIIFVIIGIITDSTAADVNGYVTVGPGILTCLILLKVSVVRIIG